MIRQVKTRTDRNCDECGKFIEAGSRMILIGWKNKARVKICPECRIKDLNK